MCMFLWFLFARIMAYTRMLEKSILSDTTFILLSFSGVVVLLFRSAEAYLYFFDPQEAIIYPI